MYTHVYYGDANEVDAARLREVARARACANLRKAARAVTQIYDEALAPSSLKTSQFTLLVTSRLTGESALGDLAEKMAMDRTTLSRNLKPLMREGLLLVRPGEDGRARLVSISPAGGRALGEAYALWARAQVEVVSALGEERHEALLGDVDRTVALAAGGSPRPARAS